MAKVVLDDRSWQKLVDQIEEKAESYTPEWRFNRENPDAGTALAEIFAKMQARTIGQYNLLSEKYRRHFFTCLNTKLKQAQPSIGYVNFGLSGEDVAGSYIPNCTHLTLNVDDDQNILMETQEDLFVSSAKIVCAYESYDKKDTIVKLYDDRLKQPFSLFEFNRENLQSHVFYLSHHDVFRSSQSFTLELSFLNTAHQPADDVYLKWLADSNKVSISYSSHDGFVQFARAYAANQKLILKKNSEQPACVPAAMFEDECLLKFEVSDVSGLVDFSFSEVMIKSSADGIFPDTVLVKGSEAPLSAYFPFSERFSIYDDVYFACREALNKKNALICLEFEKSFEWIAMENEYVMPEPNWKLIMRKSSIREEKQYDVTIAEVLWEYFNGEGWVRLFADNSYSDLFSLNRGKRSTFETMTFLCPQDIEPILIQGKESYYIRARITKINNAYKHNIRYASPRLTQTRFSYLYVDDGVRLTHCLLENNLERFVQPFGKDFTPVKLPHDDVPTLYLGSNHPFESAPVRMFIQMQSAKINACEAPVFEYYTHGKWTQLHVQDETESFSRSGLMSFSTLWQAESLKLFGQELYWIRIRDVSHQLYESLQKPVIEKIYMNTVKAKAIRSNMVEMFTLQDYTENFRCELHEKNIQEVQVWVSESRLLQEELQQFKRSHRLYEEQDERGNVSRIWVLWEEIAHFVFSSSQDRHYEIDRTDGVITFGDSRHGKIPMEELPESIKVIYSYGGGSHTNIKAHTVNGLEYAVGFINLADNEQPFTLGYDSETVDEAILRRSQEIKHDHRAVTPSDFVKIIKNVNRSIVRAECLSGIDVNGQRRSGHVTLLLLQKDFEHNREFFDVIKMQVYDALKDCVHPSLLKQNRLHIAPPLFAKLHVTLKLTAKKGAPIFPLTQKVEHEIIQFLHPINGNFDHQGWEFGRLPSRNEIMTLVKRIEGVEAIDSLITVCTMIKAGKEIEINSDDLIEEKRLLPLSGKHQIMIYKE